jgi:hypothetical protein
MKKAIAVLMILAAREGLACKNTSAVRVRFFGCPVESGHVKLGNIEVTFDKVGDHVFGGKILGSSIDAKNYPIKVAVQTPVCCVQSPDPEWKENCILEYAVYCDKRTPPWGIVASSDEPDITFSFSPQHPNEFGDRYACFSHADIDAAASTVVNLGSADIVVEVNVIRNGIVVAKFPVKRTDVENGAYHRTNHDLKNIMDEAIKQSNQSYGGDTRDYQNSKPPLPSEVTVVKR